VSQEFWDVFLDDTSSEPAIKNPVFLVGTVRSGTTFFPVMLQRASANKLVYCGFEMNAFWTRTGKVSIAMGETAECVTGEARGAEDAEPLQSVRLRKVFFEFLRDKAKVELGDADPTTLRILNKNPFLCNKLPLVSKLFPDAQYIWIHRNLISVVASTKILTQINYLNTLYWWHWPLSDDQNTPRCFSGYPGMIPPKGIDRSRWFPGGNIRYLAEYWLESNEAVKKHFKTLPKEKYIEISYESFVENPTGELQKSLNLVGIPVDPDFSIGEEEVLPRNKLTKSRLTPDEKKELFDFVKLNWKRMNELFPDRYKDLKSALQEFE